jgi:hypothetical protein
MARPRKEINQKQFENLCGLQCTKEEICAFFDITDKTLESWCRRTYKVGFSEIFRAKRELGRMSLRRSQMKMAETNPTMAIWLGKQYLGQRDNKDIVVKQTIEQEAINSVEDFLNADSEADPSTN